jgi:NADH-quinone oxidoreductase subunit M
LAHVEAPVAGSVLLAGILLKLGGYGFLRFLIPLFPEGCFYFSPLVFLLSVIAVVYGSLTTLRQVDVKRLIAYSSVAHMGLVTIGLVSMTTEGIIGALYLMIAHGVVSSALFISVTVLYDRFHTRIIKYYRGIVQVMPLFVVCFFVFILANMGTPLTANFVSEFLVLIGTFQVNTFIGFFASLGIVLSVAYNLYFFNRVSYGQLSLYLAGSSQGRDLSRREFFVLIPLVFLTFFLGICPAIMLETLSSCIQRVLV